MEYFGYLIQPFPTIYIPFNDLPTYQELSYFHILTTFFLCPSFTSGNVFLYSILSRAADVVSVCSQETYTTWTAYIQAAFIWMYFTSLLALTE